MQEDEAYESGSESSNTPTPLCKAPQLYHVSTQENLSYRPATPRTCPSPGSLTTGCCCLMFKEDEDSLLNRDTLQHRMTHHSPEKTQ